MTTRWFEEPSGLMATEEPGRTALISDGGSWRCSCGARGGAADREDAEVTLRVHRRSSLCTAGRARRTRLRKTAVPSLYDLRQAYLDADGAVAAGEALLVFLAALGAARSVPDLDALEHACAVPAHDPAVDVAALVTVVLGLVVWFTLIAAVVNGQLVLAAAGCILAGAGSAWLRHVAPVLRRRRG